MIPAKRSILAMTKMVKKMLLLGLMLTALYLSKAMPAKDSPDTKTVKTCKYSESRPNVVLNLGYLKSRKKLAQCFSKHPVSTECVEGGDGQGGETHDDVGEGHVDQVQAGVQPDMGGPENVK